MILGTNIHHYIGHFSQLYIGSSLSHFSFFLPGPRYVHDSHIPPHFCHIITPSPRSVFIFFRTFRDPKKTSYIAHVLLNLRTRPLHLLQTPYLSHLPCRPHTIYSHHPHTSLIFNIHYFHRFFLVWIKISPSTSEWMCYWLLFRFYRQPTFCSNTIGSLWRSHYKKRLGW